MESITRIFGSQIFSDEVMKARLPKDTYRAMKNCVNNGKPLTLEIANVVASSMKEWALSLGATHFCHWFQPLTGITAEKHDSFLSSDGTGSAFTEFSGKELVMGEPDASSFPSGGIRATFEARGYTAWDPTSSAFVKDDTLYIPTAFFSYSGETLDKKTPLLRSAQTLSKSVIRILKLFGDTETKSIVVTVGAEQEYFLIDKKEYLKRRDLCLCGKTLIGANPPKGQEMDDHYFGVIPMRVKAFMKELDEEAWKLGIPSKTEHNEVAPAQHELAPIFTVVNTACDQNQLLMELMKKVAEKHGLVCLLHEKPFAGVNGSGKHNNWSLSTDRGVNLLDPGNTPYENLQFLLLLCAVITAVDKHADLLRISVASAGNDCRLGASEAPPAIVSMFLGDELNALLASFKNDTDYLTAAKTTLDAGVSALPRILKDTTDRNRTSPFAFTGNKFEFRMPGSSLSIAGPNTFLNTIVADVLDDFAARMEATDNFDATVHAIIKETMLEHDRVIFNGDGYNDDWIKEAAKRGLPNYPTTVDCVPHLLRNDNVALFERHGVYTKKELRARYDVILENYAKTIVIEAKTMLEVARKDFIPSLLRYQTLLARDARELLACSLPCESQTSLIGTLQNSADTVYKLVAELERQLKEELTRSTDSYEIARICRDGILPVMQEIRAAIDQCELLLPDDMTSYPTYEKLFLSVQA